MPIRGTAENGESAAIVDARSSGATGVNLAGYFQAELGVGQIGRLLVDAVRSSGLPYSTWRNEETINRQQAGFDDSSAPTVFPITIASINADQFPAWRAGAGKTVCESSYTIGVWAWEVEEFPAEFLGSFDAVDEVWAISEFCRQAIAAKTDKPVYVLPYQIPEPAPAAGLDRAALGLSDQPYFLFAFDYQSIFERKNPLALVQAFTAEFAPGEGAQLVVKSINGDRSPADRDRLRAACAGRDDIVLIEDYLDQATVAALMADATAYVSLHRSEGYGLTLSESLALGKPVIATAYSGNLDFMTPTNSLYVGYSMVSIPPGLWPYPDTARWADPNLDVARYHLRWVFEHPEAAAELGRRARESVRATATLQRTVDFVLGRVNAITAQAEAPTAEPGPGRAAALAARHLAGRVKRRAYRELADVDLFGVHKQLAEHQQQIQELTDRIGSHDAIVQDLSATAQDQAEIIRHLTSDLRDVRQLVLVHDSELAATPFQADDTTLIVTAPDGRRTFGFNADSTLGRDYSSFEDVFRGAEGFIAERMRPYLSVLRDAEPVLDIGCGRGELLGLLRDAGIKAQGIDLDKSMVERCQAKSLDVEFGDGVQRLRDSPDGSWGGITSIEVIEHLEYPVIRELVEQAWRALRPGGILLLETVNPHSPMGLKAFWLDPTHIRPLYPEAMVVLARECGFASAYVTFLTDQGDLTRDLRRCGEYALVARKS